MKKLEEIASALQNWIAEKKPKSDEYEKEEKDESPMAEKVEDSFNDSLNMSKKKKKQ